MKRSISSKKFYGLSAGHTSVRIAICLEIGIAKRRVV